LLPSGDHKLEWPRGLREPGAHLSNSGNNQRRRSVGTPVAISTPGHELKGTVVNCTIEMSGHEIDVALEPAWSQEEFTPDHLFDPDVMIAP
jgi:hypothetical protein